LKRHIEDLEDDFENLAEQILLNWKRSQLSSTSAWFAKQFDAWQGTNLPCSILAAFMSSTKRSDGWALERLWIARPTHRFFCKALMAQQFAPRNTIWQVIWPCSTTCSWTPNSSWMKPRGRIECMALNTTSRWAGASF